MNGEDYTIHKPYQGGPATMELMHELHYLVAVRLLEYVRDTPANKMKAQMLSIVRAFLKDNGIKSTRATPVDSMADSLEALAHSELPFH